jgi:murein L,D-transpeptidase YafK
MPISELPSVFCLTPCQPEKLVHPVIKDTKLLNYNRSLQKLLGTNIELAKISILVEKSKYRLTIFYNLQPIKSYPVVFGSNPSGDKFYKGDFKTPEGIYHIRDL